MAWEESATLGIEPPTLQLTDDSLYPLSQGRPVDAELFSYTDTTVKDYKKLSQITIRNKCEQFRVIVFYS